MITQETAARIYRAYREIEAGEKLPDGGAPTVTHWMPLPAPPTSAEGVEHG